MVLCLRFDHLFFVLYEEEKRIGTIDADQSFGSMEVESDTRSMMEPFVLISGALGECMMLV